MILLSSKFTESHGCNFLSNRIFYNSFHQVKYLGQRHFQIKLIRGLHQSSNTKKHFFPVVVVPQQSAYVVERFGKFNRVLDAGLHFIIPIIDKIGYIHSLKEETIHIPDQNAITKDNVALQIDGILYFKICDPYNASYAISDAIYAVSQLAQTTMRSSIGKLDLDNTFLERDTLNRNIVEAINEASSYWGISCLRYEIKNITIPPNIASAMEKQAEAERRKRAEILQSEGERQSEINIAEARRNSIILRAEGETESVKLKAAANAHAIHIIAKALQEKGGFDAISLKLAEEYICAFSELGKTSNSFIIPTNFANDPNNFLSYALSIFSNSRSLSRKLSDGNEERNEVKTVISDPSENNFYKEIDTTRREKEKLLN